MLSTSIRKRIATEAKRRGLKLSSTLRALATERLKELDDSEELGRAEQWQRRQAWAEWEKIRAGDDREASLTDLGRAFDETRRKR